MADANGRYVLRDGMPVLEPDLFKWGRWLQTADRAVAKDTHGEVDVSTVFLGLDHSFGQGPPVLWETMVFGGPLDGEQRRYTSEGEAKAGHAELLAAVKEQASAAE